MAINHRRRIYFIEKRFQANFILKFCALVAMGGLLTIGILYFLSHQSTTVAIVNSRVLVKTTADFILPILVQTVVITMIITSLAAIVVTLFVSHKIAGPLYRLKKTMKELGEGNFSEDFKIRRLDQLQDLAAVFNSMLTKIRQVATELKDALSLLQDKLNNIPEDQMPEGRRPALRELKDISERLSKIIKYFKT